MGRISYEFTMTVISPLYVLDLEYFLLVICETPIKYGSKGMVLYYEVWYTVVIGPTSILCRALPCVWTSDPEILLSAYVVVTSKAMTMAMVMAMAMVLAMAMA